MLPYEASDDMRNVLLISSGFFVLFFGFTSAQQYLLVVFEAAGRGSLALVALLLLYGMFAVSGLGAPKLISALGGLKHSLILGACAYILFVASIALENIPFILACAALMGVGATLVWVSSGQIIVDSSSPQTRGRNLGLQTMSLYVGTALGIWVGGLLYETTSVPLMYFILAFIALFSVPFFLALKPVKEGVSLRLFRPQFLFDHRMLLMAPVLVGIYFLQGQVFTAMTLVVIGTVGAGMIPLVISAVRLCNMLGSFGGGTLSDHIGKGIVLGGFVLMALVGTYVFARAENISALLIGSVFLGLSMASIYPICISWLREKMSENEYLDALGIFHVYTNIGTIFAIIANLWLPASVSFIPAVIALLIGLPCIALFHRLKGQLV